MKHRHLYLAFAALVIANIIWGAASPIFKVSLENIPPFTLVFLRFFIASVILFIFTKGNLTLPGISVKEILILVANAISGITINIIFFFFGLIYSTSINASVIASGGPILTYITAFLFLHEPVSGKKTIGMICGLIGLLVIIIEPLLDHGLDGSLIGNIFLLIATFGAVGATLTGRILFPKYDALVLTLWTFIIASISLLPFFLYDLGLHPTLFTQLDWRGVMGILFGAILSSAVAYYLFNWALKYVTASDSMMFFYIHPIVGAGLSALWLKEPVTAMLIVGTALTFAGICISEGIGAFHPTKRMREVIKREYINLIGIRTRLLDDVPKKT